MADLLYSNYTPNPNSAAEIETLPQFMPNTLTDVVTRDFHLTEVTISNVTGSDATFTIQDRQGTPLALFKTVAIPANSTFGLGFRGRWMPGGVSVQASASSALVMGLRGY